METLIARFALLIAALLALAASAAPAASAADAVVPPGNSAATQYTEAFPTSGGEKKTDQARHHRSPAKVLGQSKVDKLKKQGPDGRAAAEAAAATAPSAVTQPADTAPAASPSKGGGGNGSSNPGGSGGHTASTGNEGKRSHVAQPAGSSGLGSALGQATGLSTEQTGALLPLAILSTILWSLAYLWRQRRRLE